MNALRVLDDNFKAINHSFLYYLHEENYYDETAFSELCGCLSLLCHTHSCKRELSSQILLIYGEVLKHIIYHFDPNDLSSISNLPHDYNEKLEVLEQLVREYFSKQSGT